MDLHLQVMFSFVNVNNANIDMRKKENVGLLVGHSSLLFCDLTVAYLGDRTIEKT